VTSKPRSSRAWAVVIPVIPAPITAIDFIRMVLKRHSWLTGGMPAVNPSVLDLRVSATSLRYGVLR
jgi:hypothetical protein